MNRSVKVMTPGVNWRDGQAVLQGLLEELLEGFGREMSDSGKRDWMRKRITS